MLSKLNTTPVCLPTKLKTISDSSFTAAFRDIKFCARYVLKNYEIKYFEDAAFSGKQRTLSKQRTRQLKVQTF